MNQFIADIVLYLAIYSKGEANFQVEIALLSDLDQSLHHEARRVGKGCFGKRQSAWLQNTIKSCF